MERNSLKLWRGLHGLRKNTHHVIPKGRVCPRNLLFLEAEKKSRSLASLGMTKSTFSAAILPAGFNPGKFETPQAEARAT
jgi:hypothetical protein